MHFGAVGLGWELATAVRAALPAGTPLFVRISSEDGYEGGWTMDDSVVFSARLRAVGVDVIDCSSGGNTPKGATNANLQALIAKVLAFVDTIKPEQIDGKEGIEIITRPGTPKEKRFSGQSYLLTYGLPQFFFHVTTAYALLRHNGVEVGKRDYMGAF